MDPEAPKIALAVDCPHITIAGNVANQVLPSQNFLDALYEVKSPYSELMHKFGSPINPFWDEIAIALLIDPTLSTNSSTGELTISRLGKARNLTN